MPMRKSPKGASKKARQKVASKNIKEFAKGPTFKKIAKKLGRKKALKVAVAAGISASRRKKR